MGSNSLLEFERERERKREVFFFFFSFYIGIVDFKSVDS